MPGAFFYSKRLLRGLVRLKPQSGSAPASSFCLPDSTLFLDQGCSGFSLPKTPINIEPTVPRMSGELRIGFDDEDKHNNPVVKDSVIEPVTGMKPTPLLKASKVRSGVEVCLLFAYWKIKRRCVIMGNLRRCSRHSASVIYFSKHPSASVSAPCISPILTHLKRRCQNEKF